jgi:hypothetical protein
MTVEKIDIINLKLAFNIVKNLEQEQIQIQDAFDNGQANYTSQEMRNR